MKRRDPIPHPIAVGDDRPQNAAEQRTDVSRPLPRPRSHWDPHGPQTASQRTLARFRAARRPAAAPNGNPRPEQRLSRPSSSHQVEQQLDLFPTPVSSPESPTGAFSSADRDDRQGAVLVTPPLCLMSETFADRLDSTSDCPGGDRE